MRIKEEFKRSGDFWLPSEPDRKERGVLSISDGGAIELEVDGRFNVEPEAPLRNRWEQIVGNIKKNEKNEFVTLDDCYYKTPTTDGRSLIGVVGRVCTGEGYNGESCFNAVTFSVEGIDEWVGKSGFEFDFQHEKYDEIISYQCPKDIPINLVDKGMQLSIIFGWTPPGIPAIKEATIRQKTYFKLVSKEDARELDEFVSIAHKITTFLCFAIDKMVSLDSMKATSKDLCRDIGQGQTKDIPINIYYPSQPYSTDEPKIHQHDMLFGFGQIQNDAGRIINNWLEAYERLNPTFDLYFSTQIGKPYLTVKLLTLVQGLEAYHHREKSLEAYRQRKAGNLHEKIEDVIEPFKGVIGNENKRRELIDKIKKTRNYLTHYDRCSESKAAEGQDLFDLCLKMELLFQLHFLQLIGFSPEQIDSLLAKSIPLSWKRWLLS